MIVDLAAETGGNCELTRPGEEIVEAGVTIAGTTNVPSTMPTHASQLLSRNMAAIVGLLIRGGELVLDWDDEIVAGACVTRQEVVAGEPDLSVTNLRWRGVRCNASLHQR